MTNKYLTIKCWTTAPIPFDELQKQVIHFCWDNAIKLEDIVIAPYVEQSYEDIEEMGFWIGTHGNNYYDA
jgi:hypothetical protein